MIGKADIPGGATPCAPRATLGPTIVSSAHLAQSKVPELSEVEYGMIVAGHAFSRWMVRCMGAAGVHDLGALDVLVLHSVYHRERPKKLADICLVLNVEDTHTVSYAVKKLEKLKLVETGRQGKEKTVRITTEGAATVARYREVRNLCLVDPLLNTSLKAADMHHIAQLLRALSGQYDQAARAATSL